MIGAGTAGQCARWQIGRTWSVGSVVSLAAAVHLAAAVPNLRSVEYWTDKTALITELATTRVAPQDGFLLTTDTPGLGITIDEATLARCTLNHYTRGEQA